jgi:hypothetical protein
VSALAAQLKTAAVVAFLRRRAVICAGAVRLAVNGLAEEIERGAHMDGEG